MQYFNYCQGLRMTGPKFHELFGGPPRDPESGIEQRHMDLAASIQAVTEDAMLAIGCELARETGMKQLVLAGGVALNCVGNGRLLREGPFDDIWIQPAAGDAGGALGAALFTWYQLLEKPRAAARLDTQKGSFLGPRFDSAVIVRMLDEAGAKYHRAVNESDLLRGVVDLLAGKRSLAGFRGEWNSVHAPSAAAASSAIHDHQRCRRR